jgi:chromosome segregation ATPase
MAHLGSRAAASELEICAACDAWEREILEAEAEIAEFEAEASQQFAEIEEYEAKVGFIEQQVERFEALIRQFEPVQSQVDDDRAMRLRRIHDFICARDLEFERVSKGPQTLLEYLYLLADLELRLRDIRAIA